MTQSKNTKTSESKRETLATPAVEASMWDDNAPIKPTQLALPTKNGPAEAIEIATTEETTQGNNLQIEPAPTPTEPENPTTHESKYPRRNNSVPNITKK